MFISLVIGAIVIVGVLAYLAKGRSDGFGSDGGGGDLWGSNDSGDGGGDGGGGD